MASIKIRVSYPAKWAGKKHLSENEVYEVSEESIDMYKSKGISVTIVDDEQKLKAEDTEPDETEKESKLVVGTAKANKRQKGKEEEL